MQTLSPINQLLVEQVQELQVMRYKYLELGKPLQAQACLDEIMEVTKELVENGVALFNPALVQPESSPVAPVVKPASVAAAVERLQSLGMIVGGVVVPPMPVAAEVATTGALAAEVASSGDTAVAIPYEDVIQEEVQSAPRRKGK